MFLFEDASEHIRRKDRLGLMWDIYRIDSPNMREWYAETGDVGGRYEICVETRELVGVGGIEQFRPLKLARILDIRVDERMENSGVGSLLLREAVIECMRLGYVGMVGDLSAMDKGHFDKLKHFYEKEGFTVEIYNPGDSRRSLSILGSVEIIL